MLFINKLFWQHIHKKYSYDNTRLHVPIGIFGKLNDKDKFMYHYVIHDKKGHVICGQINLRNAIQYTKSHPDTYLCKIWD